MGRKHKEKKKNKQQSTVTKQCTGEQVSDSAGASHTVGATGGQPLPDDKTVEKGEDTHQSDTSNTTWPTWGSRKQGKDDQDCKVEQHVEIVQAENVQVGSGNKMEIVSNTEGGTIHNTTNIGGNQSLNIYGGENTIHSAEFNSNASGTDGSPQTTTSGAVQIVKDIKANNLQINMNVHGKEQCQQPKEKEFQKFREAVSSFRDGHYIFVTNRKEQGKSIPVIGRIPWTAVFDFDASSRRSGLLSRVEESIERQRALNLFMWSEKCGINESSTAWILMNGNDEVPDSVIGIDVTLRNWKSKIKESLHTNISQLDKFKTGCTEFTVVVMWPHDSSNLHQKIHYLLSELDDNLDATIVVVDDGMKTPDSDTTLKAFLNTDEKGDKIHHIQLTFEDVCAEICSIMPSESLCSSEYNLPNNTGTRIIDMSEKDANVIAEDLEVIYSENITGKCLDRDELRQEEDNFYKGGTLSWSWWYTVGPNHVDIERDIFNEILKLIIRDHVNVYKPGTITICHNPGSGGTTLAQRILWDLKDKVPCAQMKLNTGSSIETVVERIQLLANKTNLPVVILVDGEEEHRVQSLQKLSRDRCCLIVLYVKRSSCIIEKGRIIITKEDATFFLTGMISKKEAAILDLKYRKIIADESKRQKVEQMLTEINHGTGHSLFEFGLEIHNHCYAGLESYVSGFLQMKSKNIKEFQSHQMVLAMLSLIYYYGQSSIPCHFFSGIINCHRAHKVLCFEDFPDPVKALIVKDKANSRPNGVRICHFLVAKEILNQVLTLFPNTFGRRQSGTWTISSNAKDRLAPFAKEFIRYAGERDNGRSSVIKKVITRTFISRDNKPLGEDETHSTKTRKPKFSPILEDASNSSPYTDRFVILKQLTIAFPKDSQFLAHLGRLYTICLPYEQDNAQACFESALDLCEVEISRKKLDEIPHNMKLDLMHIYHMYGNMFLLWVSRYTGRSFGDKPPKYRFGRMTKETFESTAQTLLRYTNEACRLFDQCREKTPPGNEKSCHYICEIQIRLMLCSFILNHGGFRNLHEFMEMNANCLTEFLEESSEKLDELFIDCVSIIDPEEMDETIISCNKWYSGLFKYRRSREVIRRRFADVPENMHTRRLQIAFVKMSYNEESAGIIESISREGDVAFIVQQYENNFNDENQILTKRQNDIDYREWLFAIRHKHYSNVRSLEEVLKFVNHWYERNKTPYGRFYLFILKSLIGFGDGKYVSYNREVLMEAQKLKAEVTDMARFITKPKYPREWLGCANSGIRRLVPGKRFFGLFEYREEAGLEKMVGTICPPNDKPSSGYISLDLGPDNDVPVKVFFVPGRSDMKGSNHKNARVEFELGFSLSHGYEAFFVIPLKFIRCQVCERKLEYRSCDTNVFCTTCNGHCPVPKRNGAYSQHRTKEEGNKTR